MGCAGSVQGSRGGIVCTMVQMRDSLLACPNLLTPSLGHPPPPQSFSGSPGTDRTTLALSKLNKGSLLHSYPLFFPYVEIFGPRQLGGKAAFS